TDCTLHLYLHFTGTTTTAIYPLSLHDALPICASRSAAMQSYTRALSLAPTAFRMFAMPRFTRLSSIYPTNANAAIAGYAVGDPSDRKSTRLNSSHVKISYAAFCLNKKIKNKYF